MIVSSSSGQCLAMTPFSSDIQIEVLASEGQYHWNKFVSAVCCDFSPAGLPKISSTSSNVIPSSIRSKFAWVTPGCGHKQTTVEPITASTKKAATKRTCLNVRDPIGPAHFAYNHPTNDFIRSCTRALIALNCGWLEPTIHSKAHVSTVVRITPACSRRRIAVSRSTT